MVRLAGRGPLLRFQPPVAKRPTLPSVRPKVCIRLLAKAQEENRKGVAASTAAKNRRLMAGIKHPLRRRCKRGISFHPTPGHRGDLVGKAFCG